jgi:hypothetical protein
VIWAQIAAGAVGSGLMFFAVNARARGSRRAAVASIALFAAVMTVLVGAQVPRPENFICGFVLPMVLLSACLSVEAFFIARWLVARRVRFWLFLPAYLPLTGLAAGLTTAIATVLYPGS